MLIKIKLRSIKIRVVDACSFCRFARAGRSSDSVKMEVLTLSQEFKPSATLEAKKHNLGEAASRINQVEIAPGEVFSFWRVVGNPNDSRRFKPGRTIHAGVVKHDLGGGLCQASGIIYHAALLLDLKIIERHNHSVDLYDDSSRFAPIGTDATVFYGYKDLRIKNTTDSRLLFNMEVNQDTFDLTVKADKPLILRNLATSVRLTSDGKEDVTITDDLGKIVSRSIYSLPADSSKSVLGFKTYSK